MFKKCSNPSSTLQMFLLWPLTTVGNLETRILLFCGPFISRLLSVQVAPFVLPGTREPPDTLTLPRLALLQAALASWL